MTPPRQDGPGESSGWDGSDGSAGSDIVNYTGDRNDYTVLVTDLTVTIIDNRSSSPHGTDNVTNVETFVFADGPINAPDLAAAAGDGLGVLHEGAAE